MSSALLLVGASHKVAPIEIREKLAIPRALLPGALRQLLALPEIREAFILSTCNRTEVYVLGDRLHASQVVHQWLADLRGVPPRTLACCSYEQLEADCAAHLFRVAAGLDSMVLGEVQILGQVRESFTLASQVGSVGKFLDALVRRAIQTGKRARSETAISIQATSISYAAVELTRRVFADLARATALLIGAGEMSELVAQTLADHGVRSTVFANRTIEKSSELARRYGGRVALLDDLDGQYDQADIIISSTDAPHPIVRRDAVASALGRRGDRPLFLIDLAVPRDVEPSVGELPGVHLYNVDDLRAVIASNLRDRAQEVEGVEAIVAEEVDRFMQWRQSLEVVPTITAFRQWAEEVRLAELARHQGRLARLTPEDRLAVEALTQGIVNKLLHQPTAVLKAAAGNGLGPSHAEALRQLFRLSTDDGRRMTDDRRPTTDDG